MSSSTMTHWVCSSYVELANIAVNSNDLGKIALITDITHSMHIKCILTKVTPVTWINLDNGAEEIFPAMKLTQINWIQMWKDEFYDGIFPNYVEPSYILLPPGHRQVKGVPLGSQRDQLYLCDYNHTLFGPWSFEINGSYYKAQYRVLSYFCTEEVFMPMYWARRLKKKEKLEELAGMFLATHSKEPII